MIANPDKFPAIIINRYDRYSKLHTLSIGGNDIISEKVVNLLSINIDYKSNFSNHVGKLCKKATGQLNAMED